MSYQISDKDLTKLVSEYQSSHGQNLEKSYEYYKNSNSLKEAIKLAFQSKNCRGKVHNHQRRIGKEKLNQAAKIALEYFDTQCPQFSDFDDIYSWVEKIAIDERVKKIGVLARYDISLRIAAHCGIKVDKVYCHAGTTKGAKALGLDVKNGDKLEPSCFPKPLQTLSADHIENFLCIYKDYLKGINKINSCLPPNGCYKPIKKSSCLTTSC